MKFGKNQNKKTDKRNSDAQIQSVDDVDTITDEQVTNELRSRGLRDFSGIDLKRIEPANFCYYVESDSQVNMYGFSSCYKNRSTTATGGGKSSQNFVEESTSFNGNDFSEPSLLRTRSFRNSTQKVQKLHTEIEKLKEIQSEEQEKTYRRFVLKDALFLENYRRQIYPRNVTLYNWIEFTFFPTLVYEPLYPRTASVRIIYIVEKMFISFAVMGFMFAILEKFILKDLSQESQSKPVQTIINLLVPATLMEIGGFFLVFDCILNCIAELTCFADREFYQDWWNSTSFEEFARKWNRPVHEFLLRHVYYESMSTYKLSRNIALAGTFIFSIALHEVVLCACLHKFSPWLAFMSLLQLPLMPVMKAPAFKNKPLGNIIFWAGIILGMPMTCVFYARDYCSTYDCSFS